MLFYLIFKTDEHGHINDQHFEYILCSICLLQKLFSIINKKRYIFFGLEYLHE